MNREQIQNYLRTELLDKVFEEAEALQAAQVVVLEEELDFGTLQQGSSKQLEMLVANNNCCPVAVLVINPNPEPSFLFPGPDGTLQQRLTVELGPGEQRKIKVRVRTSLQEAGERAEEVEVECGQFVVGKVRLKAQVSRVEISCLKLLPQGEGGLIRVAVKRAARMEFKVPFRNSGEGTVGLVVETRDFQEHSRANRNYSLSFAGSSAVQVVRANAQFLLPFALRREGAGGEEREFVQKLIVLRVGGAYCACLPVEVQVR